MSKVLLDIVKNSDSDYYLTTLTDGTMMGPFAHMAGFKRQVAELEVELSTRSTVSDRLQASVENIKNALSFIEKRDAQIPNSGINLQEKMLLADGFRYRYDELCQALEVE